MTPITFWSWLILFLFLDNLYCWSFFLKYFLLAYKMRATFAVYSDFNAHFSTKEVIRRRKSTDRQYNGWKKKDKRTDHDPQSTTQKTKQIPHCKNLIKIVKTLINTFTYRYLEHAVQHVMTIWETWWIIYCLLFENTWVFPPIFGGVCVARFLYFSVLWFWVLFVFDLSLICLMLGVSLDCLFLIATRFSVTFMLMKCS